MQAQGATRLTEAGGASGNVVFRNPGGSQGGVGSQKSLSRWISGHRQAFIIATMVVCDLLLGFALWEASLLVHVLWTAQGFDSVAYAEILPSLVLWVAIRALMGLYPGYGLCEAEELRRQTFAVFGTLAVTTVFAMATQMDSLSRVLVFAWPVGLLLFAPIYRGFLKALLMRSGLWGKPVFVLGAREPGARVLRTLKQEWRLGFRPVGIFDDRVAPVNGHLEGIPYGGTFSDAMSLADEGIVNTAIFALPHTRREHLAKHVGQARKSFLNIIVIPNLDGITNSAVVARNMAGTFGVEFKLNLLDVRAQRAKRAMDIVASALFGVLILPVVLLISLLIKLEAGGPVFYQDHRMGLNGESFSCLKFRTMVPDAEGLLNELLERDPEMREEYLRYHKLRKDPRVTKIGVFLRKTSLDELPQLLNVLKGDMSLVGPRPYLPREGEEMGEGMWEILRVLPGITGPWQVSGRSKTFFERRVEMDVNYVQDWSVWLDILLLARTVRCVFSGRDAY